MCRVLLLASLRRAFRIYLGKHPYCAPGLGGGKWAPHKFSKQLRIEHQKIFYYVIFLRWVHLFDISTHSDVHAKVWESLALFGCCWCIWRFQKEVLVTVAHMVIKIQSGYMSPNIQARDKHFFSILYGIFTCNAQPSTGPRYYLTCQFSGTHQPQIRLYYHLV